MLVETVLPQWLDRDAYPYESHWLDAGPGRMHYVDEGTGPVVLLLHGNPTWSFLYRHVIERLAPRYRCIAPDYLGFGLSDKPAGWSYHPSAHADTIERLIDRLDLCDLTLVVQDWGGPIGMHYAVHHPERVRRFVIMNSWAWPVDDDPHFLWFSRIVGGPLGQFLIRQFNAFARWGMPLAFGDRSRLSPEVHRQYLLPLDSPEHRVGAAVFPREVAGAAPWLDTIWRQRDAVAERPALVVWGMADVAFREKELERWRTIFPRAEVHRREGVGHFVQEELGPELGGLVDAFLERTS